MTLNKNSLKELTPEQLETRRKLQQEEKARANAAIRMAQAMLLSSSLHNTQIVKAIKHG